METLSEQTAYYDKRWTATRYTNWFGLERCLFICNSILELELTEPRICDLGCGTGWLTAILGSIGPATGVELSPKAVEQAAARYPSAQFVCADATGWKPEPGSFDVAVSQEVIEHIEDKSAYLQVARTALRAGGYLLMTTPNLDVLNSIPTKERKEIWEIQPVELPLNRAQLNALLEQNGFDVIRTGSAVVGHGKQGLHRLVNSHKLHLAFSAIGLDKAWQNFRRRTGFGMYLTTVARKKDR